MAETEALQYAIQLERDGLAFYTEAAARTQNRLGKKMLEALAADEQRHEAVLVALAEEKQVALEGDLPKKRLVTLFAELGPAIKAELDADPSDTKAVEKALDMERASIAHYQEQVKTAQDAASRALYERLVVEEHQHADILQNCLEYLNRTGQWLLWEEKGLLDGG